MPDLNLNPLIRPCVKCGTSDRNPSGGCRACVKARAAAWHAANPERCNASKVAWRTANPKKASASSEAWRAANPEKVKLSRDAYRALNLDKINAVTLAWRNANPEREKETSAAYRASNLDKVRASSLAWRTANPEKAKEFTDAWKAANPESTKIHNQNRRALKKRSGGKLSTDLAAKLMQLQKGMCPCCNLPLGQDFHLDHILPLALGGANIDTNIQLLRANCNMQKHAKHPVDYMQQKGFLL